MRILIVKLTSMGDVLHLMPALTDLHRHDPELKIDWLVEDSFSDIPTWHPAVNRILKASTRRWRKLDRVSRSEYQVFKKELRSTEYDIVIDAQGLIKSAWIARKAKLTAQGFRAGFSSDSIKESPAAWAYHKKIKVDRKQHAVKRLRQLFAGIFDYDLDPKINYGLKINADEKNNQDTIFLFHGTTWATKHLPDQMWLELRDHIIQAGFKVKLTWGNEIEKQRAQWIAEDKPQVTVLAKGSLTNLAKELASAKAAIAVDTGLGHLAAALAVPTVSIYGSTNAGLTGALGENQIWLQSEYQCAPCLMKQCDKLSSEEKLPPCYNEFSSVSVWNTVMKMIG